MKKVCEGCRRIFRPDHRVPDQEFCSRDKCQKKRRSIWQKKKRSTDKAYRENQNDAREAWAKKNKGYWRKYREINTSYADKNRELQKQRNRKRKEIEMLPEFVKSEIAKMDVIKPTNTLNSGYYILIPVNKDGIAKMDSSIVKLHFITSGY